MESEIDDVERAPPQESPTKPVEEEDEAVSKDKLFKTALRSFFKDFVELVDANLAATLDLEHPEFLAPEVFVDFKKQGHAIPDLVARVENREGGKEQLVLFHTDVEARFGEAMDKRVRFYAMHLELAFKLPVVSAVLFLKGGPNGVKLRCFERRIGGHLLGSFSYFAFGLSKGLAEEYVDLPQALAPALASLMNSGIWDKGEQKWQNGSIKARPKAGPRAEPRRPEMPSSCWLDIVTVSSRTASRRSSRRSPLSVGSTRSWSRSWTASPSKSWI